MAIFTSYTGTGKALFLKKSKNFYILEIFWNF